MKKILPLLMCLTSGSLYPVLAQETALPAAQPAVQPAVQRFDIRVYGLAEYFDWRESFQGQDVVKETGPLFGLGGDLGVRIVKSVWIELNGEIFLGNVDYDGTLQDGTPFKSTTSYVGGKESIDVAWKIPAAKNVYIKPYAGIGGREWRRDLDKSLSESQVGPHGYTETWATVYGLVGVGAGVQLRPRWEVFGNFAVKIPVYNQQNVDLSENGGPSDVELEPGKKASIVAEAGLNYRLLSASLFVETLKFSQSAKVAVDSELSMYQPDSSATIVGAKLGIHF
jgi:hypothetical protein